MVNFIGVLIDGMSYGALLFLMSIGLSVTLGMMRLINLAHTALAMVGAYLSVYFTQTLGLSFGTAIVCAVITTTLLGAVLERGVFRLVYRRDALSQVMLSIGILMMITAGVTFVWSSSLQLIEIPAALAGRVTLGPLGVSRYRLMLLAISLFLVILMQIGVERTRVGHMIRAAVENQRVAAALGIPIQKVFIGTFAVGSALAALGGALGVEALGLTPSFALQYLVLSLIVVVMGGAGSIRGNFIAALGIGVFDIACKYYLPALGSFAIYGLMLIVLLLRREGIRGHGRVSA